MDLKHLSPLLVARIKAIAAILAASPELAGLDKCKITVDCAGADVQAKIETPLPKPKPLALPEKNR